MTPLALVATLLIALLAPASTTAPGGTPAGPAATATSGAVAAAAARSPVVRPPAGATWQWQLQGRIDHSVPAQVYDVDGFETSAAEVARLRGAGRYTVCYVSAGAWERWRPDRGRFPAATLGRSNGWPGERWLDVRRLRQLAPVLRARIAMCARKGFDAVEPDNVDGYSNDTGFPLTARDQLRFNRWLARTAHRAGLAIALKNDLEQAQALEPSFDFAILEQCFQYRECGRARPFLRAGKAVFDAEYAVPTTRFCAQARRLGIDAIRKRLDLGVWRQTC